MRHAFHRAAVLLALAAPALPLAAAHAAGAPAAAPPQPAARAFPSADAAVAALVEVMRHYDDAAARAILGPGSEPLIHSGDPVADADARGRFVTAYDAKHALVPDGADRMTLDVGANDWPLPIPIVQSGGQWHFDSVAGAQELIDRRIGNNEIGAIRSALAYADAQKLYFEMAKHDGLGEYAQRIISTPGDHDGLYWDAAEGETESPLGPLVTQAQDEGYPDDIVAGARTPYLGYHFRVLKAQGRDATGGAMDYMADGHMTKGFALVAWPARYGASGIMTFIVNQDGVVYQKDLGEQTDAIATAMKRFDPDITWARVDVVDQ
jgi:hypothetical protein